MSHNDEAGSSRASSRSSADCERSLHDRAGRGSQSRGRPPSSIPPFRYLHSLREGHDSPLYSCSFNQYPGDDGLHFATVGGCRATVYRRTDDGKFKPVYCFMDPDDDEFYCCAWLFDAGARSCVLAIGGKRGTIHVIPFSGHADIRHLVGHGQAINDLATHPTDPCLLLSGSKDYEVRLWNIKSGVCVAIFGGDGGHKSEVLSCDFDLLGERIVSGGMDHCVKVWSVLENPDLDNAIEQSKIFVADVNDKNFPVLKVTYPDFSTSDVHKNYVDCVKWFGCTLVSKSCENSLCHWKPGQNQRLDFSKHETNVSLFSKCRLPNCDVWFMKFAMDRHFRLLAAGNVIGKIYVWDLNAMVAAPRCLQHNKCTTAVRQVAFSPDGELLLAVCEDSTVWLWSK